MTGKETVYLTTAPSKNFFPKLVGFHSPPLHIDTALVVPSSSCIISLCPLLTGVWLLLKPCVGGTAPVF